uniref:4-alpha-glucanotransferase n=1 Tax=Fagus sylvatica TaxID=28930 RepID=A0A2N9EXD5_FAGSY
MRLLLWLPTISQAPPQAPPALLIYYCYYCTPVSNHILMVEIFSMTSSMTSSATHHELLYTIHGNCVPDPTRSSMGTSYSWEPRTSTSMGTLHCVILLDLDPPISKVCAIKLLDLDAFTSSLVITPTQAKALIPVVRNKDNILYFASHKGVITEDVVQLRKSIGAPGMAVLQFAFGSGADNPHLPHNHERNQFVYTGTHDNDTVLKYLSINEEDDISWSLIQAVLSSVARTAIIPMQDVLGLGNSARMNIPATQFGNWGWRMSSSMSFDSLEPEATKLRNMLSMYGRL